MAAADRRLHYHWALLVLLVVSTMPAATAQQQSTGGNDGGSGPVAVFVAPPPEAVERGKLAVDKWSAQAATERGLVNALLGNACFTTAMSALNRECGQLGNDQRCWLALQFSMCFQRASGFKVLECPSVCPKRRPLQACVEECTQRMDDRQQMTYTQFFGDVLNMCLFLQTQNFQQVTAALVTDMHASSAAANTSLTHIRADLQSQSQALSQSLTALTRLQAVQAQVEAAVQAGLSEVQAVGRASHGLQQSMDRSLNMTGALSSRHEQLMMGFTELESAHQQHAARARQAFDQLADEAAALQQRQARYESLQSRLLNASESLMDQSQDMHNLLRVLMHYQAKGNTILTQLQGSSVSLQDVVFYTAALAVPLIFITHPYDVRLLLLAGVLACWGVERAILQHYVMFAGGAQSAAGLPAAQDVKLAVRLLLLGGTLGLVLWLLAKRRAASLRREAVFQAIQHSLLMAQQQQQQQQQHAVPAHHTQMVPYSPPLHLNAAAAPMSPPPARATGSKAAAAAPSTSARNVTHSAAAAAAAAASAQRQLLGQLQQVQHDSHPQAARGVSSAGGRGWFGAALPSLATSAAAQHASTHPTHLHSVMHQHQQHPATAAASPLQVSSGLDLHHSHMALQQQHTVWQQQQQPADSLPSTLRLVSQADESAMETEGSVGAAEESADAGTASAAVRGGGSRGRKSAGRGGSRAAAAAAPKPGRSGGRKRPASEGGEDAAADTTAEPAEATKRASRSKRRK